MNHTYHCHLCDKEFDVRDGNKTRWVEYMNTIGYPVCYSCWKKEDK